MKYDEEWLKVLSYPATDRRRSIKILEELERAGIRELISLGHVRVGNIHVLGKGHSSIVLLGLHNIHGHVVIKVRRTDSKKESLLRECELMRLAFPIAPKIYFCSDDVIIREYIDGTLLKDHIERLGSCREAVTFAFKVLASTYWLDYLNIDHGELAIPSKHIIITKYGAIKIIDFESGTRRRACNVCKVASWLLIRRGLVSNYCNINNLDFTKYLIKVLRMYKLGKLSFTQLIRSILDYVRHVAFT